MKKNDYINLAKEKIENDNSQTIMIKQINRYFAYKDRKINLIDKIEIFEDKTINIKLNFRT